MRPRVAITTGDPAGIGPEIAAKAAADPRVREVCDALIYSADGAGVVVVRCPRPPVAPPTTPSCEP